VQYILLSKASSRMCVWLSALVLAGSLAACAGGATGSVGVPGGAGATAERRIAAPLPGGVPFYSWGVGQSAENFALVERAQLAAGLFSATRSWEEIKPNFRAASRIIGLQGYMPLHVRWKLKDGREFLLENIDVNAIMLEYFKTHDLKMQWQREGRARDPVGDFDPLLAHEVKDDTVRIKWIDRVNHTPVNLRLTAKGAANKWDVQHEEHLVVTLKGLPTQGIDFAKKWEFDTPAAHTPHPSK
jgi:hypothetical protein